MPAARPLFALSALLALTGSLLAIEPTKTPVSPDGVRATVDLPAAQHMRNTGGLGRGGPGTGAGLCVFTSCEVAGSRWQNAPLAGFQKWMTTKPGGGSPPKLQQMLVQFCKERGVPVPDYVQHTGGDASFLDTAVRTRRLVCVTYAGMDDFYRVGIDHMVNLAHLDQSAAAIIDNNRPGNWVWMTRSEFLTRWKARGGGWAVVFLASPPPPGAGTVPASADRVTEDGPELQSRPAPPKTPDGKWVDRSASSAYVERDMGGGRWECGTGTVVHSADGASLVLTNAHVAEDGARPLAVTVGGKSCPAKYVAGSKVRHLDATTIAVDGPDLALLSVEAALPAAPLADKPPAVGTPVCLWGYGKRTAAGAPTHKTGKTLDQGNYVGAVQLSTLPTQQGDSGSGVFDAAGRLVAVHWGGDGTAKAVRLDAVAEFLAPHLKTRELAGDDGEDHGVDRAALERHTKDGRTTYWINGREVGRPQALDAVAAGGLGLVDDSDRYHLTLVTTDPAGARAALADPKLATALGKVHVQVYAPTDWPVAARALKPGATLQEPAPKGGRVLWTAAAVDAATLAEGLKRADPSYRPDPPAPVMPAPVPPPAIEPKPPAPAAAQQPEPAPPAPAPAQPSNALLCLILAVVGGILLWNRKKVSP